MNNIKITFGMIVLNGEPFIGNNLRSLYPFAHQIVVVEGACPVATRNRTTVAPWTRRLTAKPNSQVHVWPLKNGDHVNTNLRHTIHASVGQTVIDDELDRSKDPVPVWLQICRLSLSKRAGFPNMREKPCAMRSYGPVA
jgi:hypothetical protein